VQKSKYLILGGGMVTGYAAKEMVSQGLKHGIQPRIGIGNTESRCDSIQLSSEAVAWRNIAAENLHLDQL